MKTRIQACLVLPLLSLMNTSSEASTPTVAGPAEEGPRPVAVVNGESLYTEDLERVLSTLHTSANVTERGSFDLDRLYFRLVNDALLSQQAKTLGLQEEEPIPTKLRLQRIGLAREILEREAISAEIEVSEKEIEEEFAKAYRTASFHVLTTREKDQASDSIRELEEGEVFEDLARRISIDQYGLRGGTVKDVHFVDLPAAISADLFDLKPGDLAGPILSDLGWTVVRADSFADPDPAKFAIVQRFLDRTLRERKAEEARVEFGSSLRDKHPVAIDTQAEEAIGWERLQTSRIVAQIDDPDVPVATIGSQVITVKIYGNALNEEWKRIRNIDTALSRRQIVLDRLVREALFREEAVSRGYDQLPSVERMVRAKERELLVPKYLNMVLAPRVEVELDEMKVVYEENRERFRPAAELNLGQVTTTSPETAEQVAELLRQGTDLSWLASKHSVDAYKDAGGNRGWMTPVAGDQGIQDALLTASPGDVLGPYQQADEFLVVLVKEKTQPEPRPFDQVEARVRSMVFAREFQGIVDQHIQELRDQSEIVLHREVMENLSIMASPGSPDAGSSGPGHGHGGGSANPHSEDRP